MVTRFWTEVDLVYAGSHNIESKDITSCRERVGRQARKDKNLLGPACREISVAGQSWSFCRFKLPIDVMWLIDACHRLIETRFFSYSIWEVAKFCQNPKTWCNPQPNNYHYTNNQFPSSLRKFGGWNWRPHNWNWLLPIISNWPRPIYSIWTQINVGTKWSNSHTLSSWFSHSDIDLNITV